MTPRNWLDEMWYSGYCNETLEFTHGTVLDSVGKQQRLGWMHKHLPMCRECRFANTMKGIEASVAEELGQLEGFRHGADITKHPDSQKKTGEHLAAAIRAGTLDGEVFTWMTSIVKRRGRPWPGRIQ